MATYDLTHSVESGMPVYPGSDPVTVEPASTIEEDGARVRRLELDTHVGTHVDAPSHMAPDGDPLDAFDVSAFTFDARVVDCTDLADRDAITRGHCPDPDERDDAGAPDMLLFHTGWDNHWGTDRYRDHPYLSGDAAAWCADRGYSVGLDAFSPDPTPSVDPDRERASEPDGYPAHDALFAADRFVVENLTGLDALPERVTLHAFPLAIRDADGSPVRAVAVAD